ncbi:MAG: hypothetical protein ACLTTU_01065 [Bilophila wadsworthia]
MDMLGASSGRRPPARPPSWPMAAAKAKLLPAAEESPKGKAKK